MNLGSGSGGSMIHTEITIIRTNPQVGGSKLLIPLLKRRWTDDLPPVAAAKLIGLGSIQRSRRVPQQFLEKSTCTSRCLEKQHARVLGAVVYRRNWVPGGTFFFTANLLDRPSDLLVTQIGALRDAVRQVRARAPFHIDAWLVLPDHMHCLWTLPEGDTDFPGRWRAIKKGFSK